MNKRVVALLFQYLKLRARAFKDIHASDIINNNSDKHFCTIFLRRICAVYLRRICADFLSGRIFMLEVFPCQTSHMRLPGLLVCFLPCDEHIFCAEFAPFICAVYLRRFQIGPNIYARGISLSEKSHETSCALGVFFYLMMGTVNLHLERPQN